MDRTDREILNIIQKEFPLHSRPYRFIGVKIGLPEKEVFKKIVKLEKESIIRRIGAIFDARTLGWKSTLIAMKVNSRSVKKVAGIINAYSGVTHNYLRDGADYNLWFTLTCRNEKELKKIISEIRKQTGIASLISLPAVRLFKLNAYFNLI